MLSCPALTVRVEAQKVSFVENVVSNSAGHVSDKFHELACHPIFWAELQRE